MKKIIYLLLAFVVATCTVFAAETKINPDNIKTMDQYTNYVEQVFFDKTPTAFSYVKRQIIYKVEIDPAGKISNYEVLQSSGSKKYDDKVQDAVNSVLLPAFPKKSNVKKLTFTYDVEKRTNVQVPVNVVLPKIKI